MDRHADGRPLRQFVYVSDLKLANFADQVDDRARRNILARLTGTVGVGFGGINLAVQKQPEDRSLRNRPQAEQVAEVETRICQQAAVGDLATGERWISGRADMEWAPLQDNQTVLFCGYAGPLLVALGGSVSHVIGRISSGDRTGSHSRTIRAAVLGGDAPENLGRNLVAAAHAICVMPQPVRFLAQVITRGTLAGDGPQREFVLATPLYVEDAHRAGESADVTIQGTVHWFSADRGWGLISPDETEDAVVVDASAVQAGDGLVLAAGQRVEFRVTHGIAGISATSVRPLPGRIGRFPVLRRLGEGSMGVVYLARGDEGRLVAIKVIRPEYGRDAVFLRRFQAEAENARRVRAPNVARVITAVPDAEHPYLVTEFIDGPTLEEQVERHGPLPAEHALEVCAGVAAALEAIHAAGLVHRDVTPANVIMSAAGPRLIDFGIAHVVGSDTRHTQAGRPVGTPAYMSPEQINEGELTPASDVFSWAGLTVFAVTGHQPFGSRDAPWTAIWREISDGSPDLTEVPGQLRDAVAAALRKEPAERPTAAELQQRLSGPRGDHSPSGRRSRRRARLAGGAAAVAVGGVLLGVFLTLASAPQPRLVATLTDPAGYYAQGVAFSPDGHTIAGSFAEYGISKGHIDLWNTTSHALKGSPLGNPRGGTWVAGLAFRPKGQNILAVADPNGVDLWNPAGGHVSTLRDPEGQAVDQIAYTPDGKTVAEVNSRGDIYLLNAANGRRSAESFRDPVVYNALYSCCDTYTTTQITVSPRGTTLALADGAGKVYVWSLSGGSPVVLSGASGNDMDVAFSPDGKTLAITSAHETRLWNVATRKFGTLLTGLCTAPQAVAMSPDGTTLAVGDANGTVCLWNLATRHARTVKSPITSWAGLLFSPDGKTLAAFGGNDAKIYLYSVI